MSKIKGKTQKMLALAVLLASFPATALADVKPDAANEAIYTATTVQVGTITAKAQAKASPYYPKWETISYTSDYGATTFVRYLVEIGDYVEEGMPVAEIMTYVDEITIRELELKLERAQESYDAFLRQYEDGLQSAADAVKGSSGTARWIAELSSEKRTMELEKNRKNMEENMEAIKELLQACHTAIGTTQVLASSSGMVGWLNRYRPGEKIWSGGVLGGIYSTKEVLFAVTDTAGILRYGMPATLADAAGNAYQGRVVSCNDEGLSGSLAGTTAYIKPEEEIPPEKYSSLTASYETIRMENVLVVDAKAVKRDKNGPYVMELAGGGLVKRYFTEGKTVNGLCYAADGLEDGMTVVIN